MEISSIKLQRELIIRNSFFFWLNGVILLLTAVPVISGISQVLFDKEWTVPKSYELKILFVVMLFCFFAPFLGRNVPTLFQRTHLRYQFYLLVFLPLSVIFFSLPVADFLRYFSVFLLALIGTGILCYEHWHYKSLSISSEIYNKLFILSVSVTIFLIVYKSVDNSFSLFSIWNLSAFLLIFITIRFVNFHKYLVPFLFLSLLIVTFFSSDSIDYHHYSFFIGPVIEMVYGHNHPLVVDAQYGGGLTFFLAIFFKLMGTISYENLRLLSKFLTFIGYLILYFILTPLYKSRKIAILTLIAVIIFNFYSQGVLYYCCPSTGFLRFGFIYLILLAYSLEGKILSKRAVSFWVSILSSLAFIWSFESAIYTLPAVLLAEAVNKNMKEFLPIFLICFFLICFTYLSPLIIHGQWSILARYYEYALLYANGFGQIPLNRLTSFWWLYPLLYGFFLIRIMSGEISNKIIISLTIYGIALFTYFGGRAHWNNLFHVSIPFILLSVYFVLNLKSISLFTKQILLTFTLGVFLSANVNGELIIKNVWQKYLPGTRDSVLAYFSQTTSKNEIESSKYLPLKSYLKDNAIALLTSDLQGPTKFYVETHSHNAFLLNPYIETAINPKAVKRAVARAKLLTNTYLLVDSTLLGKNDSASTDMVQQILTNLQHKKIRELEIEKTRYIIFRIM